jgi:hypothetical protein
MTNPLGPRRFAEEAAALAVRASEPGQALAMAFDLMARTLNDLGYGVGIDWLRKAALAPVDLAGGDAARAAQAVEKARTAGVTPACPAKLEERSRVTVIESQEVHDEVAAFIGDLEVNERNFPGVTGPAKT